MMIMMMIIGLRDATLRRNSVEFYSTRETVYCNLVAVTHMQTFQQAAKDAAHSVIDTVHT